MAARARNALRRPVFIGAVSILTFIASLVALVVVPQQARRAAAQLRPVAAQRPDTEPTVAALNEAERQVRAADSTLLAARTQIAQLVAASAAGTPDSLAGGVVLTDSMRTRRDSLASQVAQLGQLLTRADNAPLLGSYRALAEAPAMRGDARVRQLLDSLVEIERERESYNAVGGVDPVFVALTARANELGRAIEGMATARRAALRQEIAGLTPAAPTVADIMASRGIPDTLEQIGKATSARAAAAGVADRLARERAELASLDAREERARELANLGASPPAMLAAALIFGAVIGFGFALVVDVRHPRIADEYESVRATGVRVLGVISPRPQSR
jgi:hypothetical protein